MSRKPSFANGRMRDELLNETLFFTIDHCHDGLLQSVPAFLPSST